MFRDNGVLSVYFEATASKDAIVDGQTLGTYAGAAMLGLASLRALGAAHSARRSWRRTRQRCAQRQALFQQQLQAVLQWSQATRPSCKAWQGTRELQVAAIVDESSCCRSFYLVPRDGRPLPRFEPGQYLTFELPVEGASQPLVRCYSLSCRPREDYYRVTVKRQEPPGAGSEYFYTQVLSGSTLQVQAPQGGFFLDPTDDRPVVFIGAGIGITPLLSMAESIAHVAAQRTTYLLAGFRDGNQHPFASAMRDLAANHDNLHLFTSYSSPTGADRQADDYQHHGHLDAARVRQVLPSSNFRFYICGPAAMMESLVPALLQWGVPAEDIHYEAFGPASVKGLSKAVACSEPCTVEFTQAESEVVWDGSHESLLELGESAGLSMEFGCRAGSCGQCLMTVRKGSVQHRKPPGVNLSENQCLTCIAIPQGNVVLGNDE